MKGQDIIANILRNIKAIVPVKNIKEIFKESESILEIVIFLFRKAKIEELEDKVEKNLPDLKEGTEMLKRQEKKR